VAEQDNHADISPLEPLAAIIGEAEEGPIGKLFSASRGERSPYPLGYSLMQIMDGSEENGVRTVNSSFHRSSLYFCGNYYKPISRPINFNLSYAESGIKSGE
jgi:hypothetical protein